MSCAQEKGGKVAEKWGERRGREAGQATTQGGRGSEREEGLFVDH